MYTQDQGKSLKLNAKTQRRKATEQFLYLTLRALASLRLFQSEHSGHNAGMHSTMKSRNKKYLWLFLLLLLGIGVCASTTYGAPPIPSNIPSIAPTPTAKELIQGTTQTCSADGMIMVYVPPGEFLMGSDEADGTKLGVRIYDNEFPKHEVAVSGFWIDQTEITNAQYDLCFQDGHCSAPKDFSSRRRDSYYGDPAFADYPVINVTWYQAVAYCTWAGARLPKEPEWAFAARGPDSLYYPWGNVFDTPLANYCDASCDMSHPDPSMDDGFPDTSPVGNYPAGASWVGALDLLGNVWEWNWDWHKLYEGHEWLEHPNNQSQEDYRLLRGGSWDTTWGHARSSFRNWYLPDQYENSIGFRCAQDFIINE